MQSVKETASNIAASAKSGMDKTKATVQEKVERMAADNPVEKEMATDRKLDKIHQADLHKQEVREHNAAARQGHAASHDGHPAAAGAHQISHPIGSTTAHNTHAGGYATGDGYVR